MDKKKSINLSGEAQNFLWYSYFSVSYEEALKDIDNAIKLCAQRAYLDMNRTLSFNTEDKKQRKEFSNGVCDEIVKDIKEKVFGSNPANFDSIHNKICENIINKVLSNKILETKDNDEEAFHYGQAQKWLNMTLKYMLIMGFWSDELTPIMKVLHVPVDSYIIKKVWDDKWCVELPVEKRYRSKYSSDRVKAWSKWNYETYIKFQKSLRESSILDRQEPICWESHAWLEAAQNE